MKKCIGILGLVLALTACERGHVPATAGQVPSVSYDYYDAGSYYEYGEMRCYERINGTFTPVSCSSSTKPN